MPAMPGVCSATTGVLSEDCCRCYKAIAKVKEMIQLNYIWETGNGLTKFACKSLEISCSNMNLRLTSLYEISSFGCSPELFIGPGMTTRKLEFRICDPGECCLCPR